MDREKLIAKIMKDFEADGESVTREEAEEIADIEIKAKANDRRYEQSKPKKTSTPKERKVDETKKHLFEIIIASLENEVENGSLKNEVEYSFDYLNERYTLKLTKHRKAKQSMEDLHKIFGEDLCIFFINEY